MPPGLECQSLYYFVISGLYHSTKAVIIRCALKAVYLICILIYIFFFRMIGRGDKSVEQGKGLAIY